MIFYAFFYFLFSCSLVFSNTLFVFFDAGETQALLPLLEKWEREQKEFHVLVMATAETLITPNLFPGKRITLLDLGVTDVISKHTPRTQCLSQHSLEKLKNLNPKKVIVGVASVIQRQFLESFQNASTYAFADNFNYDPTTESFETVIKVQAAAQHLLVLSNHFAEQFRQFNDKEYHIVGKPLMAFWESEIPKVDKRKVLSKMGLDPDSGQGIVTFIGGYGSDYDKVVPYFAEASELLTREGFQVYFHAHPKIAKPIISTIEMLAISDYIVGFQSSLVFDASLIGKKAVFMIPECVSYTHFSIQQGLLNKVTNGKELLHYITEGYGPQNLQDKFQLPKDGIKLLEELLQ